MTTTIGQGGNQAIESAAAMTNSLVKALSAGAATEKLSEQEIDTMFEEFQEGRVPRTRMVMAASRRKQDADAMQGLMRKDLLNLRPNSTAQDLFLRWKQTFVGAISLANLPLPDKRKLVPYDDEKERIVKETERMVAKL